MHVESIPMRWGRGDNYAYVIVDDATKEATIVDPAQPKEVLPRLQDLEKQGVKLVSITNTHHHYDHSDGNEELENIYRVPIVAGKDSPLVSVTPADRHTYKIGENLEVTAIHTPCHTQDSICYYVRDLKTQQKAVFTGDTLFNAGCGRFFEGTAEEMYKSLGSLAKLPKETKVYSGHEYTKSNAKFAQTILKTKAVRDLVEFCEKNVHTTGVFTIGDELNHNPFMLVNDTQLQKSLGASDAVAAMAKLRELKNNF
ncbi:hypothetical protein B9G98_02090 [Wickerhamiella sorbophila]|uniref:hydroxyacylglutathione hydrolase n=1 Tax=Wickerhamiella sorbophila TaxID=45607 RepID=A0A2T0FHK8_9ASCO|nr:hypothetical protein B9G98_02090 [Wickerhamiella sorbophila]PRT54470.1 hypothetical protein B9G98_02090 [Wickerhamiella sorbophila]